MTNGRWLKQRPGNEAASAERTHPGRLRGPKWHLAALCDRLCCRRCQFHPFFDRVPSVARNPSGNAHFSGAAAMRGPAPQAEMAPRGTRGKFSRPRASDCAGCDDCAASERAGLVGPDMCTKCDDDDARPWDRICGERVILVRVVHPARFSTRCGGRPAGPRRAWNWRFSNATPHSAKSQAKNPKSCEIFLS